MAETIHLDTCTSTMDEARRRAHDGAPGGTTIFTRSMQQGRGTHGRAWFAPEGGVYMSMVIRDIADPHLLTLALGCAVAETLEVAGLEPELKWVNDVWVDDKKVAGILVEAESTGDHIDFIVAGIGINANEPPAWPEDLATGATSMEDILGCDQCLEDIEVLLRQECDRWLHKVRDGQDDEILDAWRTRDALKGRKVRVSGMGEECTGTAQGIDGHGRLLVETPDGVQAFDNGSVHLD